RTLIHTTSPSNWLPLCFLFSFKAYRHPRDLHSFPTRRSSDLSRSNIQKQEIMMRKIRPSLSQAKLHLHWYNEMIKTKPYSFVARSEEHTSELQSRENLVCRLLLEKKKQQTEVYKATGQQKEVP